MSLTPKQEGYIEPIYLDYYAIEVQNPSLIDFRYRISPENSSLSPIDLEIYLENLLNFHQITLNNRFFLKIDTSSWSFEYITDLQKVLCATGRVEELTSRYIKLDSGEKWTYLPPYNLRSVPIGEEVRVTMDFEVGNEVEGELRKAHRELSPFALLTTPTLGEYDLISPSYQRFLYFLDSDFKQSLDRYPNTLSPYRLPIHSLVFLYPQIRQWRAQVMELRNQGFSSWRKSRGDGNCYYRAISAAYLESLLRSKRFEIIWSLLSRIYTQNDYVIWDKREDHHYYFYYIMKDFMEKHAESQEIVRKFQEVLEDVAFDEAIIGVFKNLAVNWLNGNLENPNIAPFILDAGANSVISEIIEDEKEASGLVFLVMACALQAEIRHILANQESEALHVECFRPEGEEVAKVNVMLRPGHYDVVYRKEEDEMDRYDCLRKEFY